MPVRHLEESTPVTPESVPRRRLARAPVIDGVILGAPHVISTEALRDDRGRQLAGTVHEDGRVEFAEPTARRVFFTGWVC